MDIFVSILIGAMCGMGVGSAGLFISYLVLSHDMEQIVAQGTNFAFFLCAALSSLPVHLKRRSLSFSRILRIAIPASIGAVVGSYIGNLIPGGALRSMFGFLLCAAGVNSGVRSVRELISKNKDKKFKKSLDKR